MSTAKLASRTRCLLSRGFTVPRVAPSALASAQIAAPSPRQFSATAWTRLDTVQTPSRGAEVSLTENYAATTGNNASGIAMLKVPKRASKSEIEALLRNKGFDIKRIQIQLDRFTFNNNALAFVELGNEQQASDAVGEMQLLDDTIFVRPMKSDFKWGPVMSRNFGGNRFFVHEDSGSAREAAKPLIEGRRKMLSVQTPGWGAKDEVVSTRSLTALKIIERYFGKHGVEAISGLSPFYGDKQEKPRMLCFMDFKTKEGAENAVQELHDTEIEGRRTWLQDSSISAWRAHQIGKVDSRVLAELQEKGLAPQETHENKVLLGKPEKTRRASQTK